MLHLIRIDLHVYAYSPIKKSYYCSYIRLQLLNEPDLSQMQNQSHFHVEITIFRLVRLWVLPVTHSFFFGVYPLAQGGGSLLGVCGAESICPRPRQRERRAAAGRVRSGHRGLKNQGETPVPLQRRDCLRQTQVRYY